MFDLPPATPTIQIELASTGISKGLAQTRGPQLVVRPALTFGAFSIEGNAKNIENNGDHGAELALSAGAATKAGGFDLSARGGLKSIHGIAGQADRRAFEMRLEAGRKFGAVRATATVTYSPDDTGSTRQSTFAEGGLAWDVRKGTRISARLGRRERGGSPDYTAYNLGVTQDIIPQLAADVRLLDTNSSELGYAYKRRLVASLRAKF
ncbi:MAG: hypothetical protein M3R03_10085 [Pseudomonadota bacterium]|nr:hypothetical protein [Pseudomonadota bacterium]